LRSTPSRVTAFRRAGARRHQAGLVGDDHGLDAGGEAGLPPFLAVIIGLALILLTIAFRSILVPLTAIGGFLLTIGATFGALVGIFQKGFGADLIGVAQPAPIISLLPIIIIAMLFGLAMDDQVFLVMSLLGERVWWLPSWLDRLLPRVDIEGAAIVTPRRPAAVR
jgi:uncharacterized membrane protein YdfJ with MMPL/SSD domain